MRVAQKGKKISEEQKLKISASLTGRKRSVETIEKMRQSLLGRKLSSETKAKMSASRTGIKHNKSRIERSVNARRGKRRTAEQCERIRIGVVNSYKERANKIAKMNVLEEK